MMVWPGEKEWDLVCQLWPDLSLRAESKPFWKTLNLFQSVAGCVFKELELELEPCGKSGRRRGLWSKNSQADTWDNAELQNIFSSWNCELNRKTNQWNCGLYENKLSTVEIKTQVCTNDQTRLSRRKLEKFTTWASLNIDPWPCKNEDATRCIPYFRIWGKIFDHLLHASNTFELVHRGRFYKIHPPLNFRFYKFGIDDLFSVRQGYPITCCFTLWKCKEPSISQEGCGDGKSFKKVSALKRNFLTPERKRQKARLWSIKLFCSRRRIAKTDLCQLGLNKFLE